MDKAMRASIMRESGDIFGEWLEWSAFHGAKRLYVLTCYLDESERAGSDAFAVAGCLFSLPQAKKFRRHWERLFAPYGGLSHWTHIYNRSGSFKGMTPDQADVLMMKGIAIIVDHCEGWVAQCCLVKDIEALDFGLKGFDTAYAVCCWQAIIGVSALHQRVKGLSRPTKFVFEGGHSDNSEANRALKLLVAEEGEGLEMTREEIQAHKESIGYVSHEFIDKKACVLLQAADAVAWESSKFKAHTLDSDVAPPRGQFAALLRVSHRFTNMKGPRLAEFARKFRSAGEL